MAFQQRRPKTCNPVSQASCSPETITGTPALLQTNIAYGTLTLLCESILALISPSRISWVSSSSKAATVVLNAVAILRMSADT